MQIIGASLPRSGHHFLHGLLHAVLGDDLQYCESHHGDCCNRLPCTRVSKAHLFRKSHDYDMSLPKDLAGCLYLVQHREPVGRILSCIELIKREEKVRFPIEERAYAVWYLAKEALYTIRFCDKWLAAPFPNSVCASYKRLVDAPEQALSEILAAIGKPVPQSAIGPLIENERRLKASRPGEDDGEDRPEFAVRDTRTAGFAFPELIDEYGRLVRSRCPSADWGSNEPAAAEGDDSISVTCEAMDVLDRLDRPAMLDLASRGNLNEYLAEKLSAKLSSLAEYEPAIAVMEGLVRRGFEPEKSGARLEKLRKMSPSRSRKSKARKSG